MSMSRRRGRRSGGSVRAARQLNVVLLLGMSCYYRLVFDIDNVVLFIYGYIFRIISNYPMAGGLLIKFFFLPLKVKVPLL